MYFFLQVMLYSSLIVHNLATVDQLQLNTMVITLLLMFIHVAHYDCVLLCSCRIE